MLESTIKKLTKLDAVHLCLIKVVSHSKKNTFGKISRRQRQDHEKKVAPVGQILEQAIF